MQTKNRHHKNHKKKSKFAKNPNNAHPRMPFSPHAQAILPGTGRISIVSVKEKLGETENPRASLLPTSMCYFVSVSSPLSPISFSRFVSKFFNSIMLDYYLICLHTPIIQSYLCSISEIPIERFSRAQ